MRPGQTASANPLRIASSGTTAIFRRSIAARTPSATAAFAAWCRPINPTRSSPRAKSRISVPRRSTAETGNGAVIVSGAPERFAAAVITSRPSPSAPVTARSPRLMMAAFSRAISGIVGPSHSMWSRSTLVIAATPPSQALVASRRPPRPTSTTPTSIPRRANQANAAAVTSSNSVAGPSRLGIRSATAMTSSMSAPKSADVDGLAVDDDPLAIAHQVRLGRLPDDHAGGTQRGGHQRLDAALAVRAADQRAAEPLLRIAELLEQCLRPPEPELDAEPAPRMECRDGLLSFTRKVLCLHSSSCLRLCAPESWSGPSRPDRRGRAPHDGSGASLEAHEATRLFAERATKHGRGGVARTPNTETAGIRTRG